VDAEAVADACTADETPPCVASPRRPLAVPCGTRAADTSPAAAGVFCPCLVCRRADV